ncbi:MAG: hypothetical protein V1797_05830 [Pseudomonadota bacterium]
MFDSMSEWVIGRAAVSRGRGRAWLLAVGVLGACLLGAAPALTLPITFRALVTVTHVSPTNDLSPPSNIWDTRWLDPYRWGDDDVLELLMERAIRDENWAEWQAYYADTEARIPLAAGQHLIRSLGRLAPVEKRLLVRMATTPEVRNVAVPSDKEDELVERVFAMFTPQKQIGPISEAPMEREVSPFLALDFLFTEDGVFSGRAWDWDNFFPRILTLAGLVISLLLIVEFLRIVVQVGVRSLSLRSKGRR